MYVTRLSLHGVEETINRPINISVVNDIKKLLTVDKDLKVFMDDKEPFNKIDRTKDKLGQIRSHNAPRDEFMVVDVIEDSTPGYDLNLVNNTPGTHPIYYDIEINAKVLPILHKRTVTMSIKYYNKSKSKVNAVLNRLRLMSSSDGTYQTHNLEYHYGIDRYVTGLISHINDLKNDRLATAVELEDYINATFDNRIDYLNSRDGVTNKISLSIREAQLQVLGYLTGELNNLKKEFEEDKGMYSIALEYKFQFDKPVALIMQYPLIVYNTPIDKRYRITPEKKLPKAGLRTKDSSPFYDVFKDKIEKITKSTDTYVHIPIEDQFEVPSRSKNYEIMFSVMSVVDPLDTSAMFYLDELPNLTFKQSILDYLEADKDFISTQNKSLFYFELYNYNKKQYSNKIILTVVTEDINGVPTKRYKLTPTTPLDIKGEYRVTFSVLNNIFNIDTVDKDRILTLVDTIDFEYQSVPVSTISNSYITLFHIETVDEFMPLTDYITYMTDKDPIPIPRTVAIVATVIE